MAHGFKTRWNVPQCIGAIDGKYILIEALENSGSVYFNYHGTFSIVLKAIEDADYKIRYEDTGCQGRIPDGGYTDTFYIGCRRRVCFNNKHFEAFSWLSPKRLSRTIETDVLACIYIDNFLRRSAQCIRFYTPLGIFYCEDCEIEDIVAGTWRNQLENSCLLDLQNIPRRSSESAQEIRRKRAKYFISP
ncbi:hypothetical protein PR048_019891 [Dryococelus australis]|uniref:DDE Tnp4 domain-containing protein n=1 Tax=Dryococelus australis TaxID=614101 RepID=A0ABQ9H4R3_9NEOP|nr:hypothetical protein PR048_019891 [Dryococelus australis]